MTDRDGFFEQVFAEAPTGLALMALDGSLCRVNCSLCEITGFTAAELACKKFGDLLHPEDLEPDPGHLRQLIEGTLRTFASERRFLDAAGQAVVVKVALSLVDGAGEEPLLIAQIEDISARKRLEDRLYLLAERDPLTGLWNRRHFEGDLVQQLGRTRRYGEPVALLVLDLDNFKYINDTLGHKAGDDMVKLVAEALRTRLRSTDTIARLGGDEFAVLLPHVEVAEAKAVATDLVAAIRATALAVGGVNVHTTVSIGIALADATLDAHGLIARADGAMYDAKEAGGDRATLFVGNSEATATARGLARSEQITAALHAERLAVFAQPVVALRDGAMRSFELLVRMIDEDGEFVAPGAFLYAAERLGLVEAIDRWMMKRAIDLLAVNAPDTTAVSISVNVSGRSLGSADLPSFVEQEVERAGIDPARLIVEVPESEAIANLGQAHVLSRRLVALGCGFALDDFRTGLSGFSYLNHLSFDQLKLDGEFVGETASSSIDRHALQAIARFAAGLGKHVVAKHVTDSACRDRLLEAGVELGQGFALAAPKPVDFYLAAGDASLL